MNDLVGAAFGAAVFAPVPAAALQLRCVPRDAILDAGVCRSGGLR